MGLGQCTNGSTVTMSDGRIKTRLQDSRDTGTGYLLTTKTTTIVSQEGHLIKTACIRRKMYFALGLI